MKKLFFLLIVCLSSLTSFAQEICPNDEIWYTSSNGKVIEPYKTDQFGANILSNTYTDGKGVIKFDGNVTSIRNSAFHNCNVLTSISIPNTVASIGNSAFSFCTSLTSVIIPDAVRSIGSSAFYYCSGLASVTMGDSITSIGEYAFDGCTALPVINNVRYADKYLIGAVDKTLSAYTIKKGTRYIANQAFKFCSALSSVTMENTITLIGNEAYYGCTGLTSLDIPGSVTSIGSSAFRYVSNLAKLYVHWQNPLTITSDVLDGIDKNTCVLYVPKGSVDNYKTAAVWTDFSNIEENPADDPLLKKYDVNGDGTVDVADITTLANYILHGATK